MTNVDLLNKPRAMHYMETCGLDAIIVASPINVGYVSGYFCWLNSLLREYMLRPGASSNLPETYAVLTRKGERELILNSIFSADALNLPGIGIHVFGSAGLDQAHFLKHRPEDQALWSLFGKIASAESPMNALSEVICGLGLIGAQIGLELDGLPTERALRISQVLPDATIKDCSNLLRVIRAAKSPEEIERMTQAAEIAERAGIDALNRTCPGGSICDAIRHFHAQAAALGAVFDHFAYSPSGFGIAMEADYLLKVDDVLYVDFGCKFGQYYSDTGLTLAMDDLPLTLERRYSAIQASIAAGVREMSPGMRSSQVQRAMADEFRSHGFGACFPHGHGLGLEVRDYPILVPDTGLMICDDCIQVPADLSLEEGMVNNLEACVFLPGVGSVHSEKSFVLTADGNRELSRQDRTHPFSKRRH